MTDGPDMFTGIWDGVMAQLTADGLDASKEVTAAAIVVTYWAAHPYVVERQG